jgi:NAD(P)H-flavin reductase
MTVWYQGTVAANEPAAAGLHKVSIAVADTALAEAHSLPGQYVRVRIEGDGEGVFAIASGPDESPGRFALLVKGGSELADRLLGAGVGTTLLLTAPEGPGFPLERAHGHRVLLFATGSGISAIRSLVVHLLTERPSFREVTLYFGARTADAFAYQDELVAWQARGITVIQTVSQPDVSGRVALTGYVQHHLPAQRLDDAMAFVCGQPEMVADVKQALRQRGVPDERIFLNV